MAACSIRPGRSVQQQVCQPKDLTSVASSGRDAHHLLLADSKSEVLSIQREGITQWCRCQEARVVGGHPGVCAPRLEASLPVTIPEDSETQIHLRLSMMLPPGISKRSVWILEPEDLPSKAGQDSFS